MEASSLASMKQCGERKHSLPHMQIHSTALEPQMAGKCSETAEPAAATAAKTTQNVPEKCSEDGTKSLRHSHILNITPATTAASAAINAKNSQAYYVTNSGGGGDRTTAAATTTTTESFASSAVAVIDEAWLKKAHSQRKDLCGVFNCVDVLYAFSTLPQKDKLPPNQEMAAFIVTIDGNKEHYKNFVSYYESVIQLFPLSEFENEVCENFLTEDCSNEMQFLRKLFIKTDGKVQQRHDSNNNGHSSINEKSSQ